jgi:hypothetical protein
MPRQVFTAGEILTAANMNDLSDQTVMVFDDSAARGSAIPSPSEGMVTYLKDTDALEKYTTDWVPAAPGKILQVVSVNKTDIFSAAVASGASTEVTNLTITHSLQNASNKLMIFANLGVVASSVNSRMPGMAIADNGSLLNIGDAGGSRTRIASGGTFSSNNETVRVSSLMTQLLYSPGDTASHVYSVRVLNSATATETIFVNRTSGDGDSSISVRGSSILTVMEVAG